MLCCQRQIRRKDVLVTAELGELSFISVNFFHIWFMYVRRKSTEPKLHFTPRKVTTEFPPKSSLTSQPLPSYIVQSHNVIIATRTISHSDSGRKASFSAQYQPTVCLIGRPAPRLCPTFGAYTVASGLKSWFRHMRNWEGFSRKTPHLRPRSWLERYIG